MNLYYSCVVKKYKVLFSGVGASVVSSLLFVVVFWLVPADTGGLKARLTRAEKEVIRDELIHYKLTEMNVHADSKENLNFHNRYVSICTIYVYVLLVRSHGRVY